MSRLKASINKEKDEFDPFEKDPLKTKAIKTQLWEILIFMNNSVKSVREFSMICCDPKWDQIGTESFSKLN